MKPAPCSVMYEARALLGPRMKALPNAPACEPRTLLCWHANPLPSSLCRRMKPAPCYACVSLWSPRPTGLMCESCVKPTPYCAGVSTPRPTALAHEARIMLCPCVEPAPCWAHMLHEPRAQILSLYMLICMRLGIFTAGFSVCASPRAIANASNLQTSSPRACTVTCHRPPSPLGPNGEMSFGVLLPLCPVRSVFRSADLMVGTRGFC
jgi:hypothetical protein